MSENDPQKPEVTLLEIKEKIIGLHKFILVLSVLASITLTYLIKDVAVFLLFLIPISAHSLAIYGMKKNYFWARSLSTFIALLLLLGFPLGTILGAFMLYYLHKKEWSIKN